MVSDAASSPGRATTVRRARTEEWDALRSLRLRALRTDPLAFGSTLEREETFPEELWRSRALRGAEASDQATFVAVTPEGNLVGTAVVTGSDRGCAVYGMWVDASRRGEGVGGLLLDAALGWAAAGPWPPVVRLEVNLRQTEAVRLYRSRGFELSGRSRPLEHTPSEVLHEMVRPARGEGDPDRPGNLRSRDAADEGR